MSVLINADTSDGLKFTSDTSGEIKLQSAGADTVTVDTSGNVGIGTTSPAQLLEVKKDQATSTRIKVTNKTNSGASTAGLLFENSTSDVATVQLWDAGTIGALTAYGLNMEGSGSGGANLVASNASGVIRFATGGTTERMRIDASGRVTTPYQPAFLAYYSSPGDITVTSQADYVPNATKYNVGSHYNTSNGRFTAPVSGYYSFEMHIFYTNSAGNTQTMGAAYKVNGSVYNGSDAIGQVQRVPDSCGGAITAETSVIMYLNSGDYVTVFARSNNNRIYAGHTHFSGRLIG